MAITKEKKEEILGDVTESVKDSKSVVFVNFHGLSVSDTTELRKNLRENEVSYKVAKKTIIKRVLNDSDIDGELPVLDGEIALAYGDDLIAPAREVYEFQKKHKESVAIVGGIFEGKYMNKEEMTHIASIPPLQVLRAQFVNLINTPIQQLVVAMDQIAEKREA